MPFSAPDTPRRAPAGFGAAAVAGAGLCLGFVTAEPLRNDRWTLLVRLAAWAVVWGIGVLCALRLPKRVAVPAIIGVAFVLRLVALAGQPILSDDLYRYAWDGRVQVAGTDPYRYTPSSIRLSDLREDWLWPDAEGCAGLQRDPGCTRINRPTVHTIYPPVAEAWFTAVYRLAGIDARHKAWQVAGLVGDMALICLLPAVLRAWKRVSGGRPSMPSRLWRWWRWSTTPTSTAWRALRRPRPAERRPPPPGVGRRPPGSPVSWSSSIRLWWGWHSSPPSPGAAPSSA